jgi:anti-sigma factor RsiW
MSNKKTCHRINEMISGYIDNELTQQQRQYVALHLESCEICQQSAQELEQITIAIKEHDMPAMEADRMEAIMQSSVSKTIQTIAWSAVLIGTGILLAFVVLEFWIGSTTSTSEKILASLIWGGLVGIFLVVVKQQWVARKADKYKGVNL